MGVERPSSKQSLNRAIRRLEFGEDKFLSNRSLVANAIIGQMLSGAVVKGGSSLKIRFGDASSRATTDFDAARSVEKDEFVDSLRERLAIGWEGFTGRLSECDQAHPRDVPSAYVMQPYVVSLSYLRQHWCNVDLELGHNELGDANDADMVIPEDADSILTGLGFPHLDPIPLMPLRYQVAQKLHGVTEPKSQRAHDLVDLQLIAANEKMELEAIREICVRLFAYRRMQEWPPVVTSNEGWESLYTEAAEGLDVMPNISDAIIWANELIQRIDEVG